MKIVLLESLAVSDSVMEQYLQPLRDAGHRVETYERNMESQVLKERTRDADVIILANMPLGGEVIDSCEKLKFIDVAFTGVDHIALDHAKEKGIAVSNASGYSNNSVAELVLGMTLSLLRNVRQVEERCRTGKTKDGLVGVELKGKTVGIIGTGAIGSRVAELFHGMGCSVAAYDVCEKPVPYITYMDLEEVLRQADIVTLHCPLTDETKGMFNAEKIAMLKQGAYFINAARGPVVDSQALAQALNEGRLAGAGIDVFEMEPPLPEDHPLLHAKNCMVTPHIAFASKESMILRAEIVFRNLSEWMKGNQINKVL